jgi:hypothetical protein
MPLTMLRHTSARACLWRLSCGLSLVLAIVASRRLVAQAPAADTAIDAAEHAARSWFALLADANYGASWMQTDTFFRQHVSREQWTVNAGRLDQQLRRQDQRKLVEAHWLKDEPPLPPAEYVVLRWLTDLGDQRQVGERMIMAHEADGSWKPATYDLFPNVDGDPYLVRDHDVVTQPAPKPAPLTRTTVAPHHP